MRSTTDGWLVCSRPRSTAKSRLFCFPHAGGAASMFSRWGDFLPDEVETWSAQLPGRENRLNELPLRTMSEAVQALAEEVGPRADLPFAFFGHSLGAQIGFELARLLRRQGMPSPFHFFVSGSCAPQLADPMPPIGHLPDGAFLDEVCSRYGGVPQEVLDHPELLRIVMVPLRADIEMYERRGYESGQPLECGITVLGGHGDYLNKDHLGGWREQTESEFDLLMFSGGHFFIQDHSERILRIVSDTFRHTLQGDGDYAGPLRKDVDQER